jgi:hypothetical protein
MLQNRLVKPEDMIFLTNQGCEDTGQIDETRLTDLGLGYGEFDGAPYPLTDQESQFIGEDVVEIGGHLALTGYSVLIGNRKYLAPAIEIDYTADEDCPFSFNFDQAKEANERLRKTMERLAETTDGCFCWSAEPGIEFKEGDGKFVSEIFIPFEYATKHAENFEQWKAHLKDIGKVVLNQRAA